MEHPEVKEKVLSVLNGNHNLPLYSQKNRLYLAEQISNIITGREVNDPTIPIQNKNGENTNDHPFGMGGVLTSTKAPAQIEREKKQNEAKSKSVKSKKDSDTVEKPKKPTPKVESKKSLKSKEKQKKHNDLKSFGKRSR